MALNQISPVLLSAEAAERAATGAAVARVQEIGSTPAQDHGVAAAAVAAARR